MAESDYRSGQGQGSQNLQGSTTAHSTTAMPRFVDPIPDTLKCTLCMEVMVNVKQTNCGHRVCGACVDEQFATGQVRVPCPMVGTENQYDDCAKDGWIKDQIVPDNYAKKQVMKFRVYCDNSPYGCQETSAYGELSVHMAECSFKRAYCKYEPKGCQVLLARQDKEKHERDCPYNVMLYPDCGTELEVGQRDAPILLEMECTFRAGPCILGKFGCSFVGSTMEEMVKHFISEKDHMLQLRQLCSDDADKLEKAQDEISGLNRIKAEMEDKLTTVKRCSTC